MGSHMSVYHYYCNLFWDEGKAYINETLHKEKYCLKAKTTNTFKVLYARSLCENLNTTLNNVEIQRDEIMYVAEKTALHYSK